MSWSWADERNQWTPYSTAISADLEWAFTSNDADTVSFSVGGKGSKGSPTHRVELGEMEQVNERTGFRRPVRRSADGTSSASISFQDEKGRWIPYKPDEACQVGMASLAGRRGTTIYVPHSNYLWGYWVDLKKMEQVNTMTKMARPIRFDRPPGDADAAGPSGSHTSTSTSTNAATSGVPKAPKAVEPFTPWRVQFTAKSNTDLDIGALTRWTVLKPGDWAEGATDPVMLTDLGDDGEKVVRLPCHTEACACTFNASTVESAFQSSNKCPTCGTLYGLPGPQPSGTMSCEVDERLDCTGHRGCGSIVITYDFPSGTQRPQHPQPGEPYHGTGRTCYLPHDAMGLQCLRLLKAAFLQGELFRVGKSATTGRENTVVWAIHQKTSPDGGPTRHGWPDNDYVQRLQSECAAANVTGALELAEIS